MSDYVILMPKSLNGYDSIFSTSLKLIFIVYAITVVSIFPPLLPFPKLLPFPQSIPTALFMSMGDGYMCFVQTLLLSTRPGLPSSYLQLSVCSLFLCLRIHFAC